MNRKHLIWLGIALSIGGGVVAFAELAAAQTGAAAGTNASGAQPGSLSPDGDSSDWGPGLHSVLKNPPSGATVAAAAGNDQPALVPIPPPRAGDGNVRRTSASDTSGTPTTHGSGVVQAAATDEAASRAAALAAADLLSAALAPPKEKPLVGRYWTLLEAEGVATGDRNRQLGIARAYWILSATQADYGWAVEESGRLEQLAAGRNPLDAGTLASAQAAAQARIQEARVAVVTAQQGLADVLARPVGDPLPLVSDPPMVGAYRTYFDTLFAQRSAPSRLRLIDRTMPLRREVIETRAATVQAAASAAHFAADALGKGQGDVQLQNVLAVHTDLSRERRAFLAAVRDYNLDIAEYALNVADPSLPNDRLVGMLIPIKPPTAGTSPVDRDPALTKPPADDPLMRTALPAADNRPKMGRDPGRAPRGPGSSSAGTAGSPGGSAAASAATAPAFGGTPPAFGGTPPAFGGTSPAPGGTAPAPGGDVPAYGRLPASGDPAPLLSSGSGTTGGTTGASGSGSGPSTGTSGPAIGGGTPAPDSAPRVPALPLQDNGPSPASRGVAP